jgi:hypothetical protein
MKIAIFHHLLPINHWATLFSEQMHRLCASGLYKNAEFVHVGINSNEASLPFYLDKIQLHRNNVFTDDIDTLTSLYNFCIGNPDYKVLYFTNLGISKGNDLNKSGWRLMLEYFNIDQWQKCTELLESYDCVGAEGHFGIPDERPGQLPGAIYIPHYSGNWWWATAKYISSLDLNYMNRSDPNGLRDRAEFWIATKKNVNYYNMFSSGHYGGLYGHYVKPTDYIL